MYRTLEFSAADRLPPAADVLPRGISLCGTSKAVGMPGIRIGWLACHDSQRESTPCLPLDCLPPLRANWLHTGTA